MSTNRHALIRYRVIDRCLRNKEKVYHLKDLIEECSNEISRYEGKDIEVKRRTIMYDLKFMKDDVKGFGAPIQNDRTDGYFYSIHDFSIFNIPIKKNDLEILRHALLELNQISGKEGFDDLDAVITRLEETYNINRSRNDSPIMQFEQSSNSAGQKYVGILKPFILNKESVAITYTPFDAETSVRYISPYVLKEYNNRWFLFGYEHDADWTITTLGLDRIQKVEKSLRPYQENPGFNPNIWLQDVVGVSIYEGAVKTKITFRAYGRTRHYINTKPIHPSQKSIKMTDTHGDFSLEVIPNPELETKLLAHGDNLEVLSPTDFRIKMAQRLFTATGRYSDDVVSDEKQQKSKKKKGKKKKKSGKK